MSKRTPVQATNRRRNTDYDPDRSLPNLRHQNGGIGGRNTVRGVLECLNSSPQNPKLKTLSWSVK